MKTFCSILRWSGDEGIEIYIFPICLLPRYWCESQQGRHRRWRDVVREDCKIVVLRIHLSIYLCWHLWIGMSHIFELHLWCLTLVFLFYWSFSVRSRSCFQLSLALSHSSFLSSRIYLHHSNLFFTSWRVEAFQEIFCYWMFVPTLYSAGLLPEFQSSQQQLGCIRKLVEKVVLLKMALFSHQWYFLTWSCARVQSSKWSYDPPNLLEKIPKKPFY